MTSTLKNKLTAIVFFLVSCLVVRAQNNDTLSTQPVILKTATGEIFGTLTLPKNNNKKVPVALIIAGSGPTDRDGNNMSMKNNSLKMLSEALAKEGIASLRYDKRGVAESRKSAKSELELRFEDYINDAKGWIDFLLANKQFSKVIVIGHSEGSLIGMIAAENRASFISIAGAGRSADLILKEQLAAQPKQIKDTCFAIIDSLKSGKTVEKVNPLLFSLFRPSVQPYMISWFKYDPQIEINKIKKKSLIVQGTKDIQVSLVDAELLSKANNKSQLLVIENMNHVLKIVEGDRKENMAMYNNPNLPISQKMVDGIIAFIKSK
jgi:alpha/beta superfamily hydrolase